MQRREFLKQACGAGLCGCAVAALFAPETAFAGDEPAATEKPKSETAAPPVDERIRFAQQRYAKLLTALSHQADPAIVATALETVGDSCAAEFKGLALYAGKPDEFLAFIREKWHGEANYDAEKKVLTVAYPPLSECPCPLVKKGLTPATICECSLGWQKHVFSVVYSRPVEATLKGSLLRGNDRCTFEVRVT